jgi:hypothetical protein
MRSFDGFNTAVESTYSIFHFLLDLSILPTTMNQPFTWSFIFKETFFLCISMVTYSPHFTRKSLRWGGLVRFGGKVYWWVDWRAVIGGKQYDAPGSYTTTYRLKTSSSWE